MASFYPEPPKKGQEPYPDVDRKLYSVPKKNYCSLSYGDANPFLKTLLGFIVPSQIFFTNWELPQASRQFRNHMQPDFDLANPGGSRGENRGTSGFV